MSFGYANGSVIRNNGGSLMGFGRQSANSLVDVISPKNTTVAPAPATKSGRTNKARAAGAFGYSGNRPIARRHSRTIGIYQPNGNPAQTASGIPNLTLFSAGSDYGIRKQFASFSTTFSTYRVGTALRSAGTFHVISGCWINPVTNGSDSFASDSGCWTRTYIGRVYYKANKPNPVLSTYLAGKKNG